MLNRFHLDAQGRLSAQPMLATGPTFAVEVAIPTVLANSLTTAGNPIPQPQLVNALIDTGASMSAVDVAILGSLGLQPTGQTTVSTPSNPAAQVSSYAVRMTFAQIPGAPIVEPMSVLGCQLAAQGIGALIGRDVLTNAVLIYNGPGGFYTLAF